MGAISIPEARFCLSLSLFLLLTLSICVIFLSIYIRTCLGCLNMQIGRFDIVFELQRERPRVQKELNYIEF